VGRAFGPPFFDKVNLMEVIMALLIPDTINPKMSLGEKTLYELFRDKLPNNFYVWHEASLHDNFPYPYFTILAPDFGLLFIAVCNLFSYQIASLDSDRWEIKRQQKPTKKGTEAPKLKLSPDRDRRIRQGSQKGMPTGKVEILSSPFQTIEEYLNRAVERLKSYPILTRKISESKQDLIFPLGTVLVMSNFTKEQSQNQFSNLLNSYPLIDKDELSSYSNLAQVELLNRLKQLLVNHQKLDSPLRLEQVETIKGVLYPEIVIKTRTTDFRNNINSLQTLDYRQERIVKAIRGGHRIIYGVAGSGKTLILLSRAKYLADRSPANYRILLLCYNRSLAGYLRGILEQENANVNYRKISVFTFYQWASTLMKVRRMPGFTTDDNDDFWGLRLLEKLTKKSYRSKWDAVLVDEAQTFFPNWFRACVAALKDTENGDLLIVSDGNQSLYKRQGFTWKSVGIKAVGRTTSKKYNLDKNYRNTQEILQASWSVVSHLSRQQLNSKISGAEDSELAFPVIEPQTCTRHGDRPTLHISGREESAVSVAVQLIKSFCNSGLDLRDIAILYAEHKLKTLELLLASMDVETYWVTASRKAQKNYGIEAPGIRVMGLLDSLGLEFKAVIILGVQDWKFNIPASSEIDILNSRKLYVAMTRARDVLHLMAYDDTSLTVETFQNNELFNVQ
jgi:hypothetical protein